MTSVPCPACGRGVARCDECRHPHDAYEHVAGDHLCRWCLRAEYEGDPSGLGPYVRPSG